MFRDANQALRWAFVMGTIDIVKLSAINKMRGSASMSENDLLVGLSPQEMRQQAADIIDMAYRLQDRACTEYIVAQYGRRFSEADIGILIERVLFMLGGGTFNRRGVRKLVLCYFGNQIGHREIRGELQCSNNAVPSIRGKVYDALDRIGGRAIAEVDNLLKSRKLVA